MGTGATREEYLQAVQLFNLPDWAHAQAEREGRVRTLVPALDLNPFYQSGDFNGDGHLDIALLVRSRSAGELGILLVHGGNRASNLIGAGEPFGNGGSDFDWLTNWRVRPRHEGDSAADALELIKLESASALIFWNGSAYQWRQLGD